MRDAMPTVLLYQTTIFDDGIQSMQQKVSLLELVLMLRTIVNCFYLL